MDDKNSQNYEMHAIVKGLVQGVGFRATTCYYAKIFGLKGTVKNLSDGSVELFVQGSKELLERLIQKLKQEMGNDLIKEVLIEYFPIQIVYSDFRIIHD